MLNCAVTILLSKKLISKIGLDFTQNLLNIFISHSKKLYGVEFIVYNVHALCHLPEEVKQYGPLDCFSAFPFENYFGEIKNLIRSPHKPLQQICRRLHEISFSDVHLHKNAEISLMHFMQHTTGPLLSGLKINNQYKKLIYKKCLFCISGYSLCRIHIYLQMKIKLFELKILLQIQKITHFC